MQVEDGDIEYGEPVFTEDDVSLLRTLANTLNFTADDVTILRQMPAYLHGLGLANDPDGVAHFITGLADRIAAIVRDPEDDR